MEQIAPSRVQSFMAPPASSNLAPLYAPPAPAAPAAPAAPPAPQALPAPELEPGLHERRLSANRMRRRAAWMLGASVASFALSVALLSVSDRTTVGPPLFLGVALAALGGFVLSLAALARGVAAAAGTKPALGAVALAFANVFMVVLGAFSALVSSMSFTRGRQIRVFGRILLPPVERGDAWTRPAAAGEVALSAETLALDAPTRGALAAQWRENGRTEHASVAAFARLTLDLVALGAPPELVASANRDALDEIRHAELCFALARALDGSAEGPGPFPAAARVRPLSRVRTIALAELAVDSLVDGAVHEGVSARIVAKLARRSVDPALRAMLKEIAADEGRHARHGWDVVRFCLAEGGEPVARALEGAMRALPERMASPLPEAARDGSWERWGVMGDALESGEFAATRADVVRKVAEAIAPYVNERAAA